MIVVILIYLVIGIIRATNIRKKASFERPSFANEHPVAYFLSDVFFWPINFAIQLYIESLLKK